MPVTRHPPRRSVRVLISAYGSCLGSDAETPRGIWDVGIIDDTGTRITDNLGAWISQELAPANNDVTAVWEKYKDKGIVRTEREGISLFLTVPFGPDLTNSTSSKSIIPPYIDCTPNTRG